MLFKMMLAIHFRRYDICFHIKIAYAMSRAVMITLLCLGQNPINLVCEKILQSSRRDRWPIPMK